MWQKESMTVLQTDILFNSEPNEKILDWCKVKALADKKIDMTWKIDFLMVESNVKKRRKCWLPAFSLFSPTMFSKAFFPGVIKTQDCVIKVNLLSYDPDE